VSDRGRSRRTARPTKATPPKAAAPQETEDEAAALAAEEAATAETAISDSSAAPAGPGDTPGAAETPGEDEPGAETPAVSEAGAEAETPVVTETAGASEVPAEAGEPAATDATVTEGAETAEAVTASQAATGQTAAKAIRPTAKSTRPAAKTTRPAAKSTGATAPASKATGRAAKSTGPAVKATGGTAKATGPQVTPGVDDDTADDTAVEDTEALTVTDAEATASADTDTDVDADVDAAEETDDEDDEAGSRQDKKARSKEPKPLTKAEKRAAARVLAAKAARRKRTGQAIAGTLIVLLAVGGAFAGVWYFGDRAEKKRIACKPMAESTFPPLLGGFDKRLATEPTIEAGTGDVTKLDKKILIQGGCKTVKPGQSITVNYVGATFKDGKIFDSSWQGKKTFDTNVGMKQAGKQQTVIEGWDEGLVGIKVGSRVQLDIPTKLAYGDTPPQGAPVGPLRFIVDILDAKDADDTGGLPGGLGN